MKRKGLYLEFENKWRVRTFDSMNLVIEKYEEIEEKNKDTNIKTGTKRMEWTFYGYYGSLSNAFSSLVSKSLMSETIDTIKKLKKSISDLKNDILDKLEENKWFKPLYTYHTDSLNVRMLSHG